MSAWTTVPHTNDTSSVVWVIDDDDVEALLIREALLRADASLFVHTLTNQHEARAALGNDAVPRPDLVILDYFLRSCEAPDLLPDLRASLGWTPIVVLSALAEKADVQRCLEARATLFVEKPVSYSGLSNALSRIYDLMVGIALFP